MTPTVVAALTVLSFTACNRGDRVISRPPASQHGPITPRGNIMLTIPDARARILRSSHIVALRAAHVDRTSQGRDLGVTFQLLHTFKGSFDVSDGGTFDTRITHQAPTEDYTSAPPGVWSLHDVTEGSRWMVFIETAANVRTAEIIREPHCRLVAPLDEVLDDVELARDLDAHDGETDFGHALDVAQTRASTLGALAMEYLWSRFGAQALRDPARFERYLTLLSTPTLRVQACTALLTDLSAAVSRASEHRDALRARFVATLFHLLAMPEAAAHHDDVVTVHLTSALGLRGALPPVAPSVLFRSLPGARDAARAALAAYHGARDTTALRAWLWSE